MLILAPEIASTLYRTGRSFKFNFKNILTLLFFPVTMPIVAYKFIQAFRRRFGYTKRPLEGKVVLITGASSGIGASLSKLLYVAGCKLILASRKRSELERVKSELVRIKTFGPVYVPAVLALDLSDLNSIPNKAMLALEIYGHVDILINNAGVSYRGVLVDTSIDVDQKLMAVNYFGPLYLTKKIVQSMIERQSGHVIFVNSVQGKIAIPHRSAYAASKHALQASADSLRAEISEHRIGVTTVSPGYVKTGLSLNAMTGTGTTYGKMDESTDRGVSPEDIAKRIISGYLNGEKEILICPLFPRLAIFLRYFYPTLFFRLMASRAKSSKPE